MLRRYRQRYEGLQSLKNKRDKLEFDAYSSNQKLDVIGMI